MKVKSLLVCVALLAIIPSSGHAAKPAPAKVIGHTILAGFDQAHLSFRLSRAVQTTLELGSDKKFGRADVLSAAKLQAYSTGCLPPNHRWFFKLTSSGRVLARGSFNTLPIPDRPIAVRVVDRAILMDGPECMPVISQDTGCPTTSTLESRLSVGIFVVAGYGIECGSTPAESSQRLHAILAGKAFYMSDGHQGLDFPQLLPLNYNGAASSTVAIYPGNFTNCRRRRDSAVGLRQWMQSIIRFNAGKRPPVAALFVGDSTDNACLTPNKLSVLFWTSVLAEVKAFDFNVSTVADIDHFTVRPTIAAETRQLTKELGLLQGAFGGPQLVVRNLNMSSLSVGAWRHKGSVYVVAVNNTNKPVRGRFGLRVAGNRKAHALWEGRSVSVNNGLVSDTFAALSVHLYRITL